MAVSLGWAFLGVLGTEHVSTLSPGYTQALMEQVDTWAGHLRIPGSYFTLSDGLDPVINSTEAQGEGGLRYNPVT